MNKTSSDTKDFITSIKPFLSPSVDVYIAVAFPLINIASTAANDLSILIGAQNMHDCISGAYTGEVSASMIIDAGAQFVILGHSERRKLFFETDEFINRKMKRAVKENIKPILCIGETKEQRDNNKTNNVLERQLKIGLEGIDNTDFIIAYEPVWAIGTGESATPEIANKSHFFIRKCLEKLYNDRVSKKIPILYGGSVNGDNIKSLIKQENIDGALVGGASLEVESFAKIIKNAG